MDWKTNKAQTADALQLALYRVAWAELVGHSHALDLILTEIDEKPVKRQRRKSSSHLKAVPETLALREQIHLPWTAPPFLARIDVQNAQWHARG